MWKLTLLLGSLLWSALASAGWDEARAAYRKGDFKTAAKEMQVLAKQGDAKAQVNLGTMYADGEGVQRDYKQAMKWYLEAANHGDTRAQINLGEMYINAQGVRKNDVEALKWNLLAASAGDRDAIPYRNALMSNLTDRQVKEAQRLAQAWLAQRAKQKQ